MNKEEQSKEQKIVQKSFYETQGYLVEQIYNPLRIPEHQFCAYEKATGNITFQESLELENGKTLLPVKAASLIESNTVCLPTEPKEYGTEENLLSEIQGFIHNYVDIHPFYKSVSAYYILMSWRFDELSVVPYLRAFGDYGSGKTRFIQTIGALCYRSMFLAGATSDAYLFRVIEMFGGTLVINELERVNTDMQSQITLILNNGYEKGMSVGRVEGEHKREPRNFNVFCPKILSTRQKFKDQALESRIISIPMRQTTRNDIPPFIDDMFWYKAQELRNKLLLYRFKHYGELVYMEKELEDKRQKLFHLEPRLRQTLLPIFYVISNKTLEEQFIAFTKDYQEQMVTDRSTEIEGVVFEKYYSLYKQDDGKVTVKQVTDAVNIDIQQERYKYSPQKIGKIIRDKLALKTQKSTGGLFYVIPNENQIEHLLARYGVESPLTPPSPLPDSDSKVDLVDIDDLPSEEQESQLKPCYVCGSAKFWKTEQGNIVCSICHPPNNNTDIIE